VVVELEAHFGQGELRARRIIGAAEPDVFGDDASIPAQAQARELEVQPARAEFVEQWILDKAGQADLIEVNEDANQGENQQPSRDADAAEVDPTSLPKAPFLAGRHVSAGWVEG
jgi:hypothetical protein